MSKAAQSHELTYDLIKRAVHGDQEAIEAYLLHYDAYINFLVSYDEVGPDGRIYRHIDEDILPLSKGGTHVESNLMALCKRCHSEITAREGGRWG